MTKKSKTTQNSGGTVGPATKNLTPWPKGISGNPGGRPKRKAIEEALLAALTPAEAQAVAKALIRQAKRGNVKAFDSLADRVDGKVPQAVTGEDGGPLQVEIRIKHIGGAGQSIDVKPIQAAL